MAASKRLVIFDTTLRDGEQSPGASMTLDEKVRIAKALERLKVDVIEAGFAAASPGDLEAISAVAGSIQDSSICSLARAIDGDIEKAALALQPTERGRIHTFIATSPIHMEYKLRMQPDQVIEQAVAAVSKARSLVADVEFSCEDAGRSDVDFLCRIIEAAISAGASTINIPDTVGYAIPSEFGTLISTLLNKIPNADKAIFSVHCHNDLGLAVANSLAAVAAGAGQVECTINGLGERAGNAALEEIIMSTRTRPDCFPVSTCIDTQHILAASRLVASVTGFAVQPNKAIVGANAFAHESGIHQDGVLKHRQTYEIMRAEDVGWGANKMVIGKHSGRAAFRSRLQALGIEFNDDELFIRAFHRFKELADKKHQIFDDDLQALVLDTSESSSDIYKLVSLQHSASQESLPEATLVIDVNGTHRTANATGSGPVDAALKAAENICQTGHQLLLYSVNAITEGTDSQGEVTVRLEGNGRIVNGVGADTDIIVASVKAYLHGLNLLHQQQSEHPQVGGV